MRSTTFKIFPFWIGTIFREKYIILMVRSVGGAHCGFCNKNYTNEIMNVCVYVYACVWCVCLGRE